MPPIFNRIARMDRSRPAPIPGVTPKSGNGLPGGIMPEEGTHPQEKRRGKVSNDVFASLSTQAHCRERFLWPFLVFTRSCPKPTMMHVMPCCRWMFLRGVRCLDRYSQSLVTFVITPFQSWTREKLLVTLKCIRFEGQRGGFADPVLPRS